MSMFIFTLGFGIAVPIMAYFTKDMGATALDVGILMSLFSAMEFIFAPAWGKVSDRAGRKPVLLAGLLGFGVFFTMTGLSTELWMVYITQALAGVFSAGIFPAAQAYVADITTIYERRKVLGLMGASLGLGMIVGPAISSVCAVWGINVPLLVAAGLALATFAFALLFLPESRSCQAGLAAGRANAPPGSVIRSPLGALMFLMLFVSFAIACIDGTMAYYTMDKFGLSDLPSSVPVAGGHWLLTGPNVAGIMFTCMGIMSIVCQGFLADRVACRIGEAPTIIAGMASMAAGIAMLPVVFDLVSLLLATCLMSAGFSFVNPCVNALVSKRTGSGNQGATMGMLGAFNSLGRVMGPAVGGLMYLFSITALYLGSAVIAVLCAAGFAGWSRRQKEQPVKTAACPEKSG